MKKKQQIDVFAVELEKLVNKMGTELDLTYAEIVGVLEIKKAALIIKALTK